MKEEKETEFYCFLHQDTSQSIMDLSCIPGVGVTQWLPTAPNCYDALNAEDKFPYGVQRHYSLK